MAAKRILDYKAQRFTGLTGTNNIEFDPFDFSTYGLTSVTRAIIEVDCVALATTDTGNLYNDTLSVRLLFTYNPSGPTSTLNATYTFINTGVQTNWTTTTSSSNGIRVVCVGQATTRTFTVFCAARMVAFVNNDA